MKTEANFKQMIFFGGSNEHHPENQEIDRQSFFSSYASRNNQGVIVRFLFYC